MGLENAEPCWLSQLGDSRAYPLDVSHKSWGARWVVKLLPERSWRIAFIVGASQKKNQNGY